MMIIKNGNAHDLLQIADKNHATSVYYTSDLKWLRKVLSLVLTD